MLKLRYYEKVTKFENNLALFLTKQLFSLSSVETSGRFFQIFVAFSEKLDFTLISLIAEEAGINVVAGGGAKVPELINEEVEMNMEGGI